MTLYTSDWNPLGKDVYYRKIELNIMSWANEINLNDFMIAAAPFGGPIGILFLQYSFLTVFFSVSFSHKIYNQIPLID